MVMANAKIIIRKIVIVAALAGFLYMPPVMMRDARADLACSGGPYDGQSCPGPDGTPSDCGTGGLCVDTGTGGGNTPEMPDILAAVFLLAGVGTVFYLRKRARKA